MNNKDRDLFRLIHIQESILKILELVDSEQTFDKFDEN